MNEKPERHESATGPEGVKRYVIESPSPFVIQFKSGAVGHPLDEPMRTVTANSYVRRPGGAAPMGLVVPTLVQSGYGERPGQSPRVPGLDKPLGTVVAGGSKHALVAAFMTQNNTGVVGHDLREPVSTITRTGSHQSLIAAHLLSLKGTTRRASGLHDPHPTVCAGGGHAALVTAFLTSYYGTLKRPDYSDPLPLASSCEMGHLVTVEIGGTSFFIADIGMRMLAPRELFAAQGFPRDYIIDRGADGRFLTKTQQIEKCGNSVPPGWAAAHIKPNCRFLDQPLRVAA